MSAFDVILIGVAVLAFVVYLCFLSFQAGWLRGWQERGHDERIHDLIERR